MRSRRHMRSRRRLPTRWPLAAPCRRAIRQSLATRRATRTRLRIQTRTRIHRPIPPSRTEANSLIRTNRLMAVLHPSVATCRLSEGVRRTAGSRPPRCRCLADRRNVHPVRLDAAARIKVSKSVREMDDNKFTPITANLLVRKGEAAPSSVSVVASRRRANRPRAAADKVVQMNGLVPPDGIFNKTACRRLGKNSTRSWWC